jgi:hypothetical protein
MNFVSAARAVVFLLVVMRRVPFILESRTKSMKDESLVRYR